MSDLKPPARINVFDLFQTDRDAEENGKWFSVGPEMQFQVRRLKSRHSTRVREQLEKPYDRQRRGGTLPTEIMEGIVHQTIVKSVLVNWKGVYGRDDKEIPYTSEAADELLTALPELRDQIVAFSVALDNFREGDDKEVAGN